MTATFISYQFAALWLPQSNAGPEAMHSKGARRDALAGTVSVGAGGFGGTLVV